MSKGGVRVAGLFVLAALLSASGAAQTQAIEPAARKDIDAGNQVWVAGVKEGRAALIAATYAENALDCAATGECVKGRAEIKGYLRARIAKSGGENACSTDLRRIPERGGAPIR